MRPIILLARREALRGGATRCAAVRPRVVVRARTIVTDRFSRGILGNVNLRRDGMGAILVRTVHDVGQFGNVRMRQRCRDVGGGQNGCN